VWKALWTVNRLGGKRRGFVKSFYAPAATTAVVTNEYDPAIASPVPRLEAHVAPLSGGAAVTAHFEGAPQRAERLHRDVLSDPCPARIAVYDAAGAPPRVEEIAPLAIGDYISRLATRTYEIARAMGGSIPFAVVNEVVENFIHADFREPVVTILDSGDTIRFSDQGPGIAEKRLAAEPGYTTATRAMKRYIRGVGSGLPLARECLSFSGGTLSIEDNLGRGAVVTVATAAPRRGRSVVGAVPATAVAPPDAETVVVPPVAGGEIASGPWGPPEARALGDPRPSLPGMERPALVSRPDLQRLSNRQKRVLALVMDSGSAGPSLVARELAIGLSTAYRDLARLEDLGHIEADESGKRVITGAGAGYLKTLLHE
jgi:anti-sigma regulatory factor (Ser/Thr protein kinase)/DNA-binding CsgD family transcriptional regulator